MNTVKSLRARFPFFERHPEVVYLDSAATTQRVDKALQAEQSYYLDWNANVHRGLYPIAEEATEQYEAVRKTVQAFLHAASPRSIVFTKGATESLNIVAQGWGGQFLKKGDQVLLSILEHHSNLVPWQLVAKKTGAFLKFCPIQSDGDLDYEALERLITPRTKIVSITGLSNVLGTLVDIKRVRALSKKAGALLCLDAAQVAAHCPIDVQALDVDFLAFSGHKLYGPTGAGALYAKAEILEAMEPWLGGGDMIREVHQTHSVWNDIPWKFEAGTPNIAQVIGMGAALEFLMELGFTEIIQHDRDLQTYALQKLKTLPFVTLYGPLQFERHRASLSFNLNGIHPHDVSALLGQKNVCIRAGHHCCMPLMEALGLVAVNRVSFGVYNSKEDVDRLITELQEVICKFRLVSV